MGLMARGMLTNPRLSLGAIQAHYNSILEEEHLLHSFCIITFNDLVACDSLIMLSLLSTASQILRA